MTVWLDAQLPPTLGPWLSANFAIDCRAVRDLGLRDADDRTIFEAARAAGYADGAWGSPWKARLGDAGAVSLSQYSWNYVYCPGIPRARFSSGRIRVTEGMGKEWGSDLAFRIASY